MPAILDGGRRVAAGLEDVGTVLAAVVACGVSSQYAVPNLI